MAKKPSALVTTNYRDRLHADVSTLLALGRSAEDIQRILSSRSINNKENPLYVLNPLTLEPPTLHDIRKAIKEVNKRLATQANAGLEHYRALSIHRRNMVYQKAMEKGQLSVALTAQDGIDFVAGVTRASETPVKDSTVNIQINHIEREALQENILSRISVLSANTVQPKLPSPPEETVIDDGDTT